MREKVDRYEKKSCGRYWPVKPEEKGLARGCRPADAGAKTVGNRNAEACSVNKDGRLKVLGGWCRNKSYRKPQKLFPICSAATGCVFCRMLFQIPASRFCFFCISAYCKRYELQRKGNFLWITIL